VPRMVMAPGQQIEQRIPGEIGESKFSKLAPKSTLTKHRSLAQNLFELGLVSKYHGAAGRSYSLLLSHMLVPRLHRIDRDRSK
jgi:hypothetical protein